MDATFCRNNVFDHPNNYQAQGPRKPGKLVNLIIHKFDKKVIEKLMNYVYLIQNSGEVGEFKKILRLELIFMITSKPNLKVSCHM